MKKITLFLVMSLLSLSNFSQTKVERLTNKFLEKAIYENEIRVNRHLEESNAMFREDDRKLHIEFVPYREEFSNYKLIIDDCTLIEGEYIVKGKYSLYSKLICGDRLIKGHVISYTFRGKAKEILDDFIISEFNSERVIEKKQ